jgi:hypothetical protein
MNVLAFIASLVSSLAWPVAVVLIVFMFRHSLARLIPGLQRLKYKDVELEFGRQVAEAKQELGTPAAPALPAPSAGKRLSPAATSPALYFRSLADVSPRAAILEAWLGFELAANQASQKLELGGSRPLQMRELFETLKDRGLLTESEVDALIRLRALRNQVVHGPEPDLSPDVIAQYSLLLQQITATMEQRLREQ